MKRGLRGLGALAAAALVLVSGPVAHASSAGGITSSFGGVPSLSPLPSPSPSPSVVRVDYAAKASSSSGSVLSVWTILVLIAAVCALAGGTLVIRARR